jgi:hypothetical protein
MAIQIKAFQEMEDGGWELGQPYPLSPSAESTKVSNHGSRNAGRMDTDLLTAGNAESTKTINRERHEIREQAKGLR